MLLPRSHAWTPVQKWLIAGGALIAVGLCATFTYHYEGHNRGPPEAAFFGTWEKFDPVMLPEGGSYYSFKPDHSDDSFIMVARPRRFRRAGLVGDHIDIGAFELQAART